MIKCSMPENIAIFLDINNPLRCRILAEQLAAFRNYQLAPKMNEANIILSDEADKIDKVEKLSVYISGEPMRLGEVLDKIQYALTKRQEHIESADTISLGPFLFLPDENKLLHIETDQAVYLTDKERQLIRCLYDAPAHRMDRGKLLHMVWRYADNAETHTFETHLYRLRQKLEPLNATWLISSIGDGEFELRFMPP